MSEYDAILTPQRAKLTVLAPIHRERFVAASTTFRKLSTAFQNHALIQILIPVFHPGCEWDILKLDV